MKPDAYADTSFLTRLYVKHETTGLAQATFSALGRPLPFTPLHRLEFRNAIRRRVFESFITSVEARRILRQAEEDLRGGAILFHTPSEWTTLLRRCEELSAKFTEDYGYRSLDLLHVALALDLKAKKFLSFDHQQRELAGAQGLKILPSAI